MTEISNVQLNTSNISVRSSSQTTSTVSNDALPMVKKLTAEEICQKLGITKDQLNEILTKNPTLNPEALTVSDVEKYLNPTEVSTVEQPVQTEEQSVVKTSDFDRKKFKDASPQEKFETLAYEAAKNNYLYGDADNQKTAEQWDALAPEEQQKLVEEIKTVLKAKAGEYLEGTDIDIENSSELIDRLMTELQTADAIGVSLKAYASKPDKEQEDVVGFDADARDVLKFNYLKEQDPSTLTRSEKEFLDRQTLLLEAVKYHVNTEAAEQGKDGYCIEFDSLMETIKNSNTDILDAQYEYLTAKAEKGKKLTAFEKEQYESLKNIVNDPIYQAADKKNIKVNEDNAINALKRSGKYSEIYTRADAASQKDMIHQALLKECKGDKELYAKKLKECTEYAIAGGDYKLAQELSVLMNKEGVTISEDDSAASIVLATQNISEGSSETAVKNDEIADKFKNKELAKAVQIGNRNHAGEHQMVDLSVLKRDDVEVQKANFDMGARAKDIETARTVYTNTYSYAAQDTKVYVASNADKAQKELQNEVLEMYTANNAEATQAAINAKTITRFHADNQTRAFKTLKTNAEELLDKNDAINALNNLSDQIEDCDSKNQLDMHNEIMSSKYSEVQEHAASNIKNYDPSVQTDAMDSVYASGNEKAIAIAVENISNIKSNNVKLQETVRFIGETALKNSDKTNLREKFLFGTLSSEEFKQLSSTERRQYIQQYFKKLPIEQKIKLLSNISNGSVKKMIYTIIARNDSNLFAAICKDKERADLLLSLGMPEDVNNKINGVVSFLAVSDIGFQNVAKKYDIEYEGGENPPLAKTVKNFDYVSHPLGQGTQFDIFQKDKFGNLMA